MAPIASPATRKPAFSQQQGGRGIFTITRLHAHEGSSAGTSTVALEKTAEQTNSQTEVQQPQDSTPQRITHDTRTLQQKAGRKLFFASHRSLTYLDGTLPGDYGFDPLGLADPALHGKDDPTMNLRWLSYAELVHGRWAMLGAAGALAPEVLARAGVIPETTGLPWFEAGGLYPARGTGPAIPFFGDIPFKYWVDQYTLFWTMLVAMGFAEFRRLQDYVHPGSMKQQYFLGLERVLGGSGQPAYPGGQFFNIAALGKTDEGMRLMKTREVKHGRLAMIAFLGLMVQAQTTHKGPIQNIYDHMANPSQENLLARVGAFIAQSSATEKVPFMIWLLAGFGAAALLFGPDEKTEAKEKKSL